DLSAGGELCSAPELCGRGSSLCLFQLKECPHSRASKSNEFTVQEIDERNQPRLLSVCKAEIKLEQICLVPFMPGPH
ncbi:unnamed protein product, partial [Gulo gulo]